MACLSPLKYSMSINTSKTPSPTKLILESIKLTMFLWPLNFFWGIKRSNHQQVHIYWLINNDILTCLYKSILTAMSISRLHVSRSFLSFTYILFNAKRVPFGLFTRKTTANPPTMRDKQSHQWAVDHIFGDNHDRSPSAIISSTVTWYLPTVNDFPMKLWCKESLPDCSNFSGGPEPDWGPDEWSRRWKNRFIFI